MIIFSTWNKGQAGELKFRAYQMMEKVVKRRMLKEIMPGDLNEVNLIFKA